MTEERLLVEQARAGDLAAVEELCVLHWENVYYFVYRRLRDHHEAEDLTQETFFRSLKGIAGLREPAFFRAYLYRVAQNLVVDRSRKAGRFVQVDLDVELLDDEGSFLDEEACARDEARTVREALDELPPDHSRVLRLRLVEGLSVKETAVQMGRSAGAVRSLQYRAVRELRELLKERGLLVVNGGDELGRASE